MSPYISQLLRDIKVAFAITGVAFSLLFGAFRATYLIKHHHSFAGLGACSIALAAYVFGLLRLFK